MEGTDLTNGTVKTLVDSGGYSAWRLGKTIDLNAYCEFLEQNADWLACTSCLTT